MSYIRIDMSTKEDGKIGIKAKAECSISELEAATGFMMVRLVKSSPDGIIELEKMFEELKEVSSGDRTADTEEDNNIS